jgi:hypothetical protein
MRLLEYAAGIFRWTLTIIPSTMRKRGHAAVPWLKRLNKSVYSPHFIAVSPSTVLDA